MKKIKNIPFLLIAIITMFVAIVAMSSVFAETPEIEPSKTSTVTVGQQQDGNSEYNFYTFTIDGGTAYCMDGHKPTPDNGASLTLSRTLESGADLCALVKCNGQEFAKCQSALWFTNNTVPQVLLDNATSATISYGQSIASQCSSSWTNTVPKASVTVSKPKLNGNNYESTVTVSGGTKETCDATATVNGTNVTAQVTQTSNGCTVKVPKSSVTSGATLTITGKGKVSGTKYRGEIWSASSSSIQEIIKLKSEKVVSAEAQSTNSITTPSKVVTSGLTNGKVKAGGEVTYTITYANNTTSPAEVTVTDIISGGTYVSSSETPISNNNGTIIWKIPSVPANSTGTLTVTTKANNCVVKMCDVATGHDATDYAIGEVCVDVEVAPECNLKPIRISKHEIAKSAELPGATIIIRTNTGEIREQWTSTNTVHQVSLSVGEYVLTETVAPSGYEKITTNIKFKVNEDGSVSQIGTDSKYVKYQGNHMIIYNETAKAQPVDDTASVISLVGIAAGIILTTYGGVVIYRKRHS